MMTEAAYSEYTMSQPVLHCACCVLSAAA